MCTAKESLYTKILNFMDRQSVCRETLSTDSNTETESTEQEFIQMNIKLRAVPNQLTPNTHSRPEVGQKITLH